MNYIVFPETVSDEIQQFGIFGGVLFNSSRDRIAASEHCKQERRLSLRQLVIATEGHS